MPFLCRRSTTLNTRPRRIFLCVSCIVLLMLPVSSAAPSDIEVFPDSRFTETQFIIFQVVKTILFCYVTHIMTVRPDGSATFLFAVYKRLCSFAWPTSGVHEAFGSVIKVYRSNSILGINHLSTHTITKAAEVPGYFSTYQHSPPTAADLTERSLSNPTMRKFYSQNRWSDVLEESISPYYNGEHDNVSHLARILETMGPTKARKVKHCILNGNLYIGFNRLNELDGQPVHRPRTENMRVAGSGSVCIYQVPVHPTLVRYLPHSMIDELQQAYFIEETCYTQIFMCFIQMAFTVYECVIDSGDRWFKIVLIVFMVMSFFQTLSAIILPTQVAAYSIHCLTEGERIDPLEYQSPNNAQSSSSGFLGCMPTILRKSFEERDTIAYDVLQKSAMDSGTISVVLGDHINNGISITSQPAGWWEAVVIVASTLTPFMIGFWAGYGINTLTEWLVVAWIGFSGFFTIIRVFLFDPNFMSNALVCFLFVILFVFPGLALVLASTITGYKLFIL
ncbi:hypothetical protein J3Q64DRAFT_1718278 [Phycomyces blakesleeanus]|uniref:Transmembrane protein n=1 Tax=Phycomyces blakesleeanus TaxID=4837 RepID=A0ABR3B8H7_PHYBL